MREQEKRIKEQRTIEAARKNMMGPSGKIGTICRYMGEPIKEHGGGLVETRYFNAPWYDEINGADSDIPTFDDEDDNIFVLGWFFDGTTNGIHLEIKYTEATHELAARWKGYLVYQEVKGELQAYTPFPEWESKVEQIYKLAKEREKVAKKQYEAEEQEEAERAKESWLESVMRKWGLK